MGLAWWEIISKPSPGGPTEGVSHGTATLSHVGLDPNQLHHCLLLRCVSSASTLDKMSLHHPAMIPGSPLRPSPLVLSMLLAPKMSRPSPGTPNVTSHHLQDCRSRPQTALALLLSIQRSSLHPRFKNSADQVGFLFWPEPFFSALDLIVQL